MKSLLDRERLRCAFDLMEELLARRSPVCRVYVFGGSAMVLAFDERGSPQHGDWGCLVAG